MDTTYGDISQRTAAWAATEMLAHAEPIIVLGKFGQNKPIPKNKADTVKFRRPVPFAISLAPLSEGVTPTAQQMAYVDVTAQTAQYGAVCIITDKVNDLSEDPVLKDATTLSGEQAAETVEMVTWGVVKGGTNVFYANGTTRAGVNNTISNNKQDAVVRSLRNNRGKAVTMMLSGGPEFNTSPVEGGFIAFGHTDLEHDVRALTDFIPVANYGSRKPLCPEELGSCGPVRYILSPLLTPFLAAGSATLNGMKSVAAANVDVYPVIYIAKEAYGLCPLKGASAITPSVINPDTKTKDDPLGQRGYVGWKTYFVAVRLNENWMARLEVGATDL
jgi:N4-gp56 family major capsid protein